MSLEAAEKFLQKKTGEAFVSTIELEQANVRINRLHDLSLMVEILNNLTGIGYFPPNAIPFESLGFSPSELRRLHDLYEDVYYKRD